MRRLPKPRPWARLAITVGVTAATFLTLGFVGAEYVRSPAEVAAETEPPEPSQILVPVERRRLRQTVEASATIPNLAAQPLSADGQTPTFVTATPRAAGDEIAEGEVVVEVSGRPLLTLQGAFPFYRDLSVGDSGADVFQLQSALSRMGHYHGAIDGQFGPQVSEAIADWYRNLGYAPPRAQDQDRTEAVTQDADLPVLQAGTALDQAQRELDAARADVSRVDDEAAAVVAAAQAAYDAVTSDEQSTEQDRREAKLQLDRATHEAQRLKEAAHERVRRATEQASIATAALSQARGDSAEAHRQADLAKRNEMPTMSASEIIVVNELPATLTSVKPVGTSSTDDPPARLRVGAPTLEVELKPAQARLVRPGQLATVTGTDARGTVESVTGRPAQDAASGSVAIIKLAGGTIPHESPITVEIVVDETHTEVNSVPITAIVDLPDGAQAVLLAGEDDQTEVVEVKVGMHANGWVQISPRGPRPLEQGARVVVGASQDTTRGSDDGGT